MKKQVGISIGVNNIKEKDIATLNRLMLQLNPASVSVNLTKIKKVMKSGIILTLRDASKNNLLIGVGTLVMINKLSAFSGSVEDVVVDESYRSQGHGRKIIEELCRIGKLSGMKYLDLTSAPNRESANKLYQSVGFERRETNVYRFFLK